MRKFMNLFLIIIMMAMLICPQTFALDYNRIKGVSLIETFRVPQFGDVPNQLTDIQYMNDKKSFRICSDGGDGELPLSSGTIIRKPPAFMALTGDYIIRGYCYVGRTLCAVDNRRKFIFYQNQQIPFPRQINDISGVTCDGVNLWVTDRRNNQFFCLKLANSRLILIRTVSSPGGIMEGAAWDGERLWVCDQSHFYIFNKNYALGHTYKLPVSISGFCFADDGYIYATGYEKSEIYKLGLY